MFVESDKRERERERKQRNMYFRNFSGRGVKK
jgi:hypothetical protein